MKNLTTYINSLSTNQNDNGYTNNSIANQLSTFVTNLYSKNNIYYSTGINSIDELLGGGLSPSTITVLGGLCGMGKTTLALQIAWYISNHYHKDVLFLACEMSEFQLQVKLISSLTAQMVQNNDYRDALTYDEIRLTEKWENCLSDNQANNFINTLNLIQNNPHLYIKSIVGKTSAQQIKEYIELHIKETGNEPIIFIDYLQNICEQSLLINPKQVIDNAMYMLNGIAHEYETPIVALSSLGRSAYSSPSISAAKGSGEIEYTAANVLLLTNVEEKKTTTTTTTKPSQRTSNRQSNIGTKVLVTSVKNRFTSSQKSCQLNFIGQYNVFI